MKTVLFSLTTRYGIWVLALLALVIAPAATLYFMVDLRERLWTYLGYGYLPVGMWLTAFLASLIFARHSFREHPHYWVGSALFAMAVLGGLSLFYPQFGTLDEVGMSGSWGTYFGGFPLYLGIPKILGLLILVAAVFLYRWHVTGSGAAAASIARFGWLGLLVVGKGIVALFGMIGGMLRSTADDKKEGSAQEAKGQMGKMLESEDLEVVSQKPMATVNGASFDDGKSASEWMLPSLDLLEDGTVKTAPQETLNEMSACIESTLADYGVDVSVKDIKTGPRIIRFGLVPGRIKKSRESKTEGEESMVDMGRVKVQSIVSREADLALALKTSSLRIQPQVPGEGFVGLEVPNPSPSVVPLKSVVTNPEFQKIVKHGGLPIALGQDTGGEPVVANLLSLPHLLVAGSTGSGKSVCINSVVMSLLLSNRPDRLRMLMVDPKRVELTPFNGIPHLYAPVIVDPEEVLDVLAALLREMFHRYKLMEDVGVRNIVGYNNKSEEKMPYALLIIDELADLMMTSGFEVEQSLVRLAQLGRATGIHLILCTQRPSVKVVTGLLKANIPGRIAFAVASQVDSRVILDGSGADKLLGKGDMLYLSAQSPTSQRIQGTFVADSEFDAVIDFWKEQKGPPLPAMPMTEPDEDEQYERVPEDDELLQKAREMCEKYQHVSPAVLQRRLQIGYTRAMHLLEVLEEEGLVAAGDPGKSRQVVRTTD